MRTALQFQRYAQAVALCSVGLLTAAGCATKFATEPTTTATPTSTQTVDEFYTPAPSGEADDYYVMNDGEDDVEYSYFIDEQDYLKARDLKDDDQDAKYYHFITDYVKRGHGYGDHNHIHEFVKVKHHYHGVYIGERERDWTDSIALTSAQKLSIDTAMKNFGQCAKANVDSFRVQMKPYRDEFRTRKLAIIAELDSGKVTRDSARLLLDSAIAKYETETQLMRAAFVADLKECRAELDVAIKAILTPTQYDIWTRHRGW